VVNEAEQEPPVSPRYYVAVSVRAKDGEGTGQYSREFCQSVTARIHCAFG